MSNMEDVLNAIIQTFRKENELKKKNIFEVFALSQIYKEKELDFTDIYNSIVDGGQDGGVDSILFFIDDKNITTIEELEDIELDRRSEVEINIIQSKDSNGFKESVFDKLSLTFKEILNSGLSEEQLRNHYNADLVEKISVMRKLLDVTCVKTSNIKVNLLYISKGDLKELPKGVSDRGEILKTQVQEEFKVPKGIEIQYYGADELRDLYLKPEETELVLKTQKNVNSVFVDENNVAYVALAKLEDYFDFITDENRKIKENIFESNVRHFQGDVTVNKKITQTLKEGSEIEFWWLNNGVTIIASEIVAMPNEKLKLSNVQIVNGLQTTYCIYNELKEKDTIDDKRSVMIKIIKVNEDKFVDRIISATNSQTEVRAADLRATDDFQRDIESCFLSSGYYYDRRKNYYKNLGKNRNKIFTIAKTAQYVETILFKSPHSARSNPTSLLKTDSNYNKIFNKDININVYLKVCLIFKISDGYIKDLNGNDPIQNQYNASIKNYTFHIMLLMVYICLEKTEFTDIDVNELDLENLNIEVFNKAVEFLIEFIDNYKEETGNDNIINIAKSKSFTDYINGKIEDKTKVDITV
ncbi:AIPR family protein [Clostridium baratii str. Sullivan]|uniref:AIPR family protein n=1 Tax=Clostridium baratii str. Sullivan TaxID=1415775 RepID=A0A0A7FXM3_9CLOT|nr:AIPR family protein [Clostridium baratii]AIY84298.1 AIPR family protein [Clostridium baratii str. Sullivan]